MPRNISADQIKVIRALADLGASLTQMAQITGLSKPTVHRHRVMMREKMQCEHDMPIFLCRRCTLANGLKRKMLEELLDYLKARGIDSGYERRQKAFKKIADFK